jgi:DNA-directed RNA polymerase specialized sigma24 family protein
MDELTETQAQIAEERRRVARVLDELTAQETAIFQARRARGDVHREIGETSGISAEAVIHRVKRVEEPT